MTETRTPFEIIDSVTVKLWNRFMTGHDVAGLAMAYVLTADAREEVCERDGIVWSDVHGWTTPEMRAEV